MDAAAIEQLLKTTAMYGLGFVFTAGVLFGLLWVAREFVNGLRAWLPILAQRHIAFMDKIEQNSERSAEAIEALAGRTDGFQTRKALGHFAQAAKAATADPHVHVHLDRVMDEVRDRV